jgi:transcriptional regulator with XRE-family HTH domain
LTPTEHTPPTRQLHAWRIRRGLSQLELAKAAGLQQKTISEIETGKVRDPHPGTLRKLAAALDADIADVFPDLLGNSR